MLPFSSPDRHPSRCGRFAIRELAGIVEEVDCFVSAQDRGREKEAQLLVLLCGDE